MLNTHTAGGSSESAHRTTVARGRRRWLKAAIAAPVAVQIGALRAQEWPSRPIRLVLPSGAGGGSDIFGRPMAQYFGNELKCSVVVENKPGANGIVAHEAIVRQAADGYSLVISYSAAIIGNKLLQPKMSHDPLVDLQPIGRIGGGGGNALIVNADLPVRNIGELVEYSKLKGPLSYASWGIASGGHLIMEMMKKRTGLSANHVPYKTVAQIPPDIVSGVVPVAWIDAATPVPLVRSGRVRVIAVAAQKRLPQFLDALTLTEQNVPFDIDTWYGLFAPAGLPADIVSRLNAVLNRWLALPETSAYFEDKQNTPAPIPLKTEEFVRLIQRDIGGWKSLIADSGVTL
jgi:tripartite-type tricarboxylate transporter receptor subunit TctC